MESAFAHIKNEATQFPDIEFSPARFDIVVLVGAGIIPETPVFEPDRELTRYDLAAWVALANQLGEGGETPDVDALAAAALETGVVESLDGTAAYRDLNDALFGGRLEPADPDRVPTKAEAASFIAAQLGTAAAETLLAGTATRVGPTGSVDRIETRANADGGSTYIVTIGGSTLPMYAHGRVANGPIDLTQWRGRSVRRSFVRDLGDLTLWTYLEAEPPAVSGSARAADETASSGALATNHGMLYVLAGAAVALGALLFFRRGRRS